MQGQDKPVRTLRGRRKSTLPGRTISSVERSRGSMAAKYLQTQLMRTSHALDY